VSLTAKDVAEIMRLLEDSSFDALDLEVGDMRLSLRRGEGGIAAGEDRPAVARAPSAAPTPTPAPDAPTRPAAALDPGVAEVPSPLLGVFYRAPKPGEPPFVEAGAKVEPDTIIAIIEVMKLMNTVRAGVAGEVTEILAVNGALVEYGEPLIRVRRAD
jgi:acetyl-CoA carboxylase biotin carboxyl carrier protein